MKRRWIWVTLMGCLTLTCLMTPSTSWSQTARTDSVKVMIGGYRSIKAENIDLMRELVHARVDLDRSLKHHQADKEDWATREEWLKSQLPSWYERPLIWVMITAVVTIWATLQAVQISI